MQTTHLYTLRLPSYLTLIIADRNSGTKADWMFYLWKNTSFYVEKSYLCCQLDIFSSIQMRHGSLFKLRPCGKAIAIQCQHFNACSTGSSTVGWKRGIKLLVLLSRKSINWSRLQHTLKQQYRYKSQNTMAKLHHTVKYRCRHARAWTGLCILHISTGTFSHNCKVLSGGDLPPSLKSAL